MIKGTQKKMIVLKTSDSALFEEAYFVVRHDGVAKGEDMIAEANRIIECCGNKRREHNRISKKSILLPLCMFLGGSTLGSIVTFVLFVLFSVT